MTPEIFEKAVPFETASSNSQKFWNDVAWVDYFDTRPRLKRWPVGMGRGCTDQQFLSGTFSASQQIHSRSPRQGFLHVLPRLGLRVP